MRGREVGSAVESQAVYIDRVAFALPFTPVSVTTERKDGGCNSFSVLPCMCVCAMVSGRAANLALMKVKPPIRGG